MTNVAHKPVRDAGPDDVRDLFRAFDKRWGDVECGDDVVMTWAEAVSAMTRDNMQSGWTACKKLPERPTLAQFVRACVSGDPNWKPRVKNAT